MSLIHIPNKSALDEIIKTIKMIFLKSKNPFLRFLTGPNDKWYQKLISKFWYCTWPWPICKVSLKLDQQLMAFELKPRPHFFRSKEDPMTCPGNLLIKEKTLARLNRFLWISLCLHYSGLTVVSVVVLWLWMFDTLFMVIILSGWQGLHRFSTSLTLPSSEHI